MARTNHLSRSATFASDIESRILSLFLEDDQDALDNLSRHYGSEIRRQLNARFGHVLNDIELDDAYSRALFRAWKYRASIDHSKSLRAWFFRICLNEAITLTKQMPKSRVIADELPQNEYSQTSDKQRRLIVALRNVIEELPKIQREVVLADLAAPGGKECSTVLADQLGSTPNSIRASRSKARKRIHENLGGFFNE